MLVLWEDEAHALGYDLIDAGHRLVVDTINRLNSVVRSGGGDKGDTVGECLQALQSQLSRQFQHEEAVMLLSHSVNLPIHRRAHRRMLETLAHLHRRHEAGENVTSLLLINLVAFLTTHLRGLDCEEFGAAPARWVA